MSRLYFPLEGVSGVFPAADPPGRRGKSYRAARQTLPPRRLKPGRRLAEALADGHRPANSGPAGGHQPSARPADLTTVGNSKDRLKTRPKIAG